MFGPALKVKEALSPDKSFGLGLRLAREATEALAASGEAARLREEMAATGLHVFTVNAFPYGAFHGTRVKEAVYAPDWLHPKRLDYTRRVFDVLAELLPPGMEEGSVSTVPLSYGGWADRNRDLSAFVDPLVELTRHLARLEEKTGKLLHLGLEPEPDCTLETTGQTVDWFHSHLFKHPEAALLRRHIGVCFDTCHVAMQFEDPESSFKALRDAGIRVSKVQVSAALECKEGVNPGLLRSFDDGVYLHQVKSSQGQSWPDLPAWFSSGDRRGDGTLRVHCHVPLDWEGDDQLCSTRHTLRPGFWRELLQSECRHVEVETYTFGVLPEALRRGTVEEDITRECLWAKNQLQSVV